MREMNSASTFRNFPREVPQMSPPALDSGNPKMVFHSLTTNGVIR